MNYLDIKKKIEGLRLRGAEKVNIAEAMYCIYYPITGNKKDLESCLLRIVSCLITNEINKNTALIINQKTNAPR